MWEETGTMKMRAHKVTVLRLTGHCLHVCVHLRRHKFPMHRRNRQRGTRDEQPLVRVSGLWIDELMVTDEGNKELDVPPVTIQEPVWITHLRLCAARGRCRGQPCPPRAHIYNETHTQTRRDFHEAAEQNCHTKQFTKRHQQRDNHHSGLSEMTVMGLRVMLVLFWSVLTSVMIGYSNQTANMEESGAMF